jgi:hypothetical protein
MQIQLQLQLYKLIIIILYIIYECFRNVDDVMHQGPLITRILLEKLMVVVLVKNTKSSRHMKPEGSLTCSHNLVIGSYTLPDESSPRRHTLYL